MRVWLELPVTRLKWRPAGLLPVMLVIVEVADQLLYGLSRYLLR